MRSLCSIYAIGYLFCTAGISQETAVSLRDWTSSDGKVISAELVGFSRNIGQFRTKEGRRFEIADDKFSMLDQAVIFRARMNDLLDLEFAKDINTEFYYSKQIPANRRSDLLSATLAFGPNRFNLGLYIPRTPGDFKGYENIIVKNSTDSFTYKIGSKDIATSGTGDDMKSRIRLFLRHNRDEGIIPVIEKGLETNTLQFVVVGQGEEKRFELSDSEKNSLREVIPLFAQASKLILGSFLKTERLSEQTFSDKEELSIKQKSPSQDLERFREQLAKKKYGTVVWTPANEAPQEADGLDYLGTDIIIRTAQDEVKRVPFTEIDKPSLRRFYEMRLEESFGKNPLTTSSGDVRYLHKDWEGNRQIYSQTIFFTVLKNNRGYLALNTWSGSFDGAPMTDIYLRGDNQEKPFKFVCQPAESKFRKNSDTNYTTTFHYLNESEAAQIQPLIDAESIDIRMISGAKSSSVTLKEDELHVTREGIAIHQWFQALK